MFALGSLHCALASGAVYCNRSCLCVCMFVAGGRCPRARSVWVSLSAFFIVRLWRSRRSRTVVFWRLAVKREVARRRLLPPLTPRTGHAPPVRKPRTPTWTSDLRGRYFAWNCTIPVVMLATVVATTATLSSNSCKSNNIFDTFYFHSVERVRCERHVS